MIRPAFAMQDQLRAAHAPAMAEPRCRYFVGPYATWKLDIEESEWRSIQMVSTAGPHVLGYFGATVDRVAHTVDSMSAVAYQPGHPVFGRDLAAFLLMLVERRFVRIGWLVILGNPAESMYDRAVARLGGRIVGTRRKIVRMSDGTLGDDKLYEILTEEIPADGLAWLRKLAAANP